MIATLLRLRPPRTEPRRSAQRRIAARDPDLEHWDKAVNEVLNKKRCRAPAGEASWESLPAARGWQAHHPELWPAPYFSLAKSSSKSHLGDVSEARRDSHRNKFMAQRRRSHAINIRVVQESWPAPAHPRREDRPLPRPLPQPNFLSFWSHSQCCSLLLKHPQLWKELGPGSGGMAVMDNNHPDSHQRHRE